MSVPQLDELELMHNTICKAVSEPRRIQILYALHKQPLHVNALAQELDIPQPTVSRHLSVLRQGALVEARREGTQVIYSLTEERMIDILDKMRGLLRHLLEKQTRVLND